MTTIERARIPVAIVGSARCHKESDTYRLAFETGKLLVDSGFRVLTGGMGGVMEAACLGGRSSPAYNNGDTIGILPGHGFSEANEAVDIVLPTGLDLYRNGLVAHASAVIALGGGAGTLSEIALAWSLKRLVIAYRIDGWSGRLADTRLDERIRHASISNDMVYGVDSAPECIALLQQLIPLYEDSHRGIA